MQMFVYANIKGFSLIISIEWKTMAAYNRHMEKIQTIQQHPLSREM